MLHRCGIALLPLLFSAILGYSQNLVVINHPADTIPPVSNSNRPFGSEQHSILINYYEPVNETQRGRLEYLIGQNLDYYIDACVQIVDDELVFRKNSRQVLKDLNTIVEDGTKYYNYKALEDFKGFSERVNLKIEEIYAIDLSIYPFENLNDSLDRQRQQYYTIQKELNDLKLLLNTEIGNFTNNNLLILSDQQIAGLSPDQQNELLEEVRNFNKYDPLEPVEIELSPTTVAVLMAKDDSSLVLGEKQDDYPEQIIAMIQENADRLDQLQDEVELLRSGTDQTQDNPNIQLQLEEFKRYIESVVQSPSSGDLPPLPQNLPQEVNLYYATGSSGLSTANKLVVNEIIDILARNPRLGIIITGFADQSGHSARNYELSRKRAKNVRHLALESGIQDHRILMNFFGDSRSDAQDPMDRKVRIEFIQY